MWASPDIKEHVKEDSDFRIGKVIKRFSADSNNKNVGDFKYVMAGRYTYMSIPDLSPDEFFVKLREVATSDGEKYNFSDSSEYRTAAIADANYHNSAMFPVILLTNDLFSNSDFNKTNLPEVVMLSQQKVSDIILQQTNNYSRTIKEFSGADQQKVVDDSLKIAKHEEDDNIITWMNTKVPNHDFNILKDNPMADYILNTVGADTLVDYVTRIDKYRRDV